MKFEPIEVSASDDYVVVKEIDIMSDLGYERVSMPAEQTIIVAKEMIRIAKEILAARNV